MDGQAQILPYKIKNVVMILNEMHYTPTTCKMKTP